MSAVMSWCVSSAWTTTLWRRRRYSGNQSGSLAASLPWRRAMSAECVGTTLAHARSLAERSNRWSRSRATVSSRQTVPKNAMTWTENGLSAVLPTSDVRMGLVGRGEGRRLALEERGHREKEAGCLRV